MPFALGIDVGTTFTAAAVWRDERVEMVPLETHRVTVPSIVFADGDTMLFGTAAAARGVSQPAGVAREFKRRLGDPVPLMLSRSPYSADRLVATFARWVVDSVAEQAGERPSNVVVTHPANWTEFQLHLLSTSLEQAGLDDVGLMSEPQAAAHDFGTAANLDSGSLVLVYDLGGGTFDVALLRRDDVGFSHIGESAGVERLGGIDFDEAVFQYVIDHVGRGAIDTARGDATGRMALAQLRRSCVEAKETLSGEVAVEIPVVLPGHSSTIRLTRSEFEDMIRPMLGQTIELSRRVLTAAGLSVEQLTAILLVGGSSRIPLVSELIARDLGAAVRVDAHPKLVVARGAARWAGERPIAGTPPRPRPRPAWLAAAAIGAVALLAAGGVYWAANRGDASDESAEPPEVTVTSEPTTSPDTEPDTEPDTSPANTSPTTTSRETTTTVAQPPGPAVVDVTPIGRVRFTADTTFDGTVVGGLTGLALDPADGTYLIVSDGTAAVNDVLFYRAEIDVSDGVLDEGDVVFTGVATLLSHLGVPYGPEMDAEAMAFTDRDTLAVASEGDASTLQPPFIHELEPDGTFVTHVPLPDWYLPTSDGTSGIQPQRGLNALASLPSQSRVVAGIESSLVQDEDSSDPTGEKFARLLVYDTNTWEPIEEYRYPLDPAPPEGSRGDLPSGLLELLAIGDGSTLLALERSVSSGEPGQVLYEIDLSTVEGAPPSTERPPLLEKTPLFNARAAGIVGQFQSMALGPELPDGRASVIWMTDNEFRNVSSDFLALALELGDR